jgi:hypothetical protein
VHNKLAHKPELRNRIASHPRKINLWATHIYIKVRLYGVSSIRCRSPFRSNYRVAALERLSRHMPGQSSCSWVQAHNMTRSSNQPEGTRRSHGSIGRIQGSHGTWLRQDIGPHRRAAEGREPWPELQVDVSASV